MRRIASHVIVASLLLTLFAFALNGQPVKASGLIYIRADGRIEGTTQIQTADNITYVFTANLSGSIVVERENIIINGMNYALKGAGSGTGISLSERSNVTIENAFIRHFNYGVSLESSSNNSVIGNNIASNNVYGIYLDGSSNNSVSKNKVTTSNVCAIYVNGSSNNNVSENNITANSAFGFWLDSSSHNNLVGNNIANNNLGVFVYDSSNNSIMGNTFSNDGLVVDCSGNAVADNLVNGKPLVYIENVSDYTVSDAGQVILVNCNRTIVENLNLSHTDIGVELFQTNNSKISGNNITENSYYGIRLYSSSNNSIDENNITANNYGGIRLYSSANINISRNDIRNNYYGIWLDSSSNNSISGNRLKNNVGGISLDYSVNNKIYHNDFINNEQQTLLTGSFSNIWDDGYPSGGNYWSDYSGVDVKSGPFQNETGSDGIGDTPHIINGNNADNYPLMKPYVAVHDIGVRVSISKPVIFEGYNPMTTINFTITNYGAYAESFNFTFKIDTITQEQNITLASINSTTITFNLNTTDFAKGDHIINAYATPVPGETDITDNNCTNASVQITNAGDLGSRSGGTNVFGVCDGLITSTDLQLFLQCYKGIAPTGFTYLGDLGSRVSGVNTFFVCDGLVTSTDLNLFLQCYRGTAP